MRVAAVALFLAAVLAWPRDSTAQTTRLRLSQFSGNFGNTVVADFDAGYRDSATSTMVRVDVSANPSEERVAELRIRADTPTLGGGKPVSDLLWRLDEVPNGWTPLSTADSFVYGENLTDRGDGWQQRLWFRMLLDWEDPPANYGTTLTFTLVVSAP